MRKSTRNPAADFFEDKGFYIILFLCVAAIGISGYVLFFTPKSPAAERIDTAVYEPTVMPSDIAPAAGNEDNIPVEGSSESGAEDNAESETEPQPQAGQPSSTTEQADTAAAPTVTQPSAPVFVRPVSGAVSVPYSDEELVYQATFGDWRTHMGTDYAAKLGDRVYAITDGTVEDVYTDALNGPCVRLKHADGLETLYMGLGEKVKVKKGQAVKAGDVIGVVDNTNLAESAQEPHLHVEAFRDGKHIDPESLLTSGAADDSPE
ncbi:MAG: peptidoglycan DD-metalloendopeptidase family protein [Intestinibacillus sp.]